MPRRHVAEQAGPSAPRRTHSKGKHEKAKHAAVARHGRQRPAAESAQAAAPLLTGDLAAVKQRDRSGARGQDLARRASLEENHRGSGGPESWSNGSWCVTRRLPTRPSAGTRRSLPITRAGRASGLMRRRAEARLWQERSDAGDGSPLYGRSAARAPRGRFGRWRGRCLPRATVTAPDGLGSGGLAVGGADRSAR